MNVVGPSALLVNELFNATSRDLSQETLDITEFLAATSKNNNKNPFQLVGVLNVLADLLYLFSIFLIGAIVRHATDVLLLPVPYTVVVFFVGMVAGYLPLGEVIDIGPHTILYVFMPVLIFEGAFAIDVYIFKQIIVQVLVLAAPALAVMTFMLAGMSVYLFKYPGWNWTVALLFGSILSATDPVAVVAIMKELGTSKRLALLIEGESMLNDGTAMVCFEIFLEIIEKSEVPSALAIVQNIIWVSCGGPLLGFVMARVAIFWLQWTFNDSLTEIAITLSMAYLVFYVADAFLSVSAVLAVVTLGATLSEHRTSISPEVEVFLHSFWETLAFMANTMIFAICGFIITKQMLVGADLQDCVYVIIIYFAVQVSRGVTIVMFSPLLKRLGYGLTWQDGLVCSWSGLRGAIGLTLALIVFKSENKELASPYKGAKILFHVSLIVVATLMINATTMSYLLTFLGLTDVTPARRLAMKKAIRILDESRLKTLNVWRVDRFLADADWTMVNKLCTIEDPFTDTETTQEKEQLRRQSVMCPHCNLPVPYIPTSTEIHQMTSEAIRKYLKLLKQNFWLQFERGLLAGFSVRKLLELAEEAGDQDCEMIRVREIKKMWRPKRMNALKDTLKSLRVRHHWTVMIEVGSERSLFVNLVYLLSQSTALQVVVFGLDVSQIIAMLVALTTPSTSPDLIISLQYTNVVTVTFNTMYFLFRVFLFRSSFSHTVWFFLAALCLLVSYIDILLRVLILGPWFGFPTNDLDSHHSGVLHAFIILRTIRILQALEPCLLLCIYLVKSYIRAQLSTGCDLARGFVRANELAIGMIDHISDETSVRAVIKANAESAKMSILRELGLMQSLHPDIALGVKTHQAIRSVLNVMREGMHHLMEEGGIDEPEGLLFVKVIESKMKRLMAAPPKLQIPSTRKILAAIPWIDKEDDLVDLILHIAEKKIFQYGEVVMRVGDAADGIYIIISGLIRVEAPLLVDSATSFLSTHVLDFLATGNVIGEISMLTSKPRSATLTCETIVKTLYLSKRKLDMVCDSFSHLQPPLLDRLWKVCAVRIAVTILSNVPSYHGMRKETLLARVEHGMLAHVGDTNVFEITPSMVDIILILGEAYNPMTREKYVGSCYIPMTVGELRFSPNQTPRPLMFYVDKMETVTSTVMGHCLNPICADNRSKSFINLTYSHMQDMEGLDKLDF